MTDESLTNMWFLKMKGVKSDVEALFERGGKLALKTRDGHTVERDVARPAPTREVTGVETSLVRRYRCSECQGTTFELAEYPNRGFLHKCVGCARVTTLPDKKGRITELGRVIRQTPMESS